jgi:hypothetical protein
MGWQFVAPRRMENLGMGWNDPECESEEKEWVAPLLQPQTFALNVGGCLTLIMKLTMPNGYTDTTVRLSNG